MQQKRGIDFTVIHDEMAIPLRNFLFYKTGNLEQSKDLAQESFIRLWSNLDRVKEGKVKSYLFTIANRLFLDHTDHQKVILKFQRSQK
ncbi:MAG: sigma factor, partial [Bacteroidota bacterium]